jgi:hypothetical protein
MKRIIEPEYKRLLMRFVLPELDSFFFGNGKEKCGAMRHVDFSGKNFTVKIFFQPAEDYGQLKTNSSTHFIIEADEWVAEFYSFSSQHNITDKSCDCFAWNGDKEMFDADMMMLKINL